MRGSGFSGGSRGFEVFVSAITNVLVYFSLLSISLVFVLLSVV
jgi:hypothetical protein